MSGVDWSIHESNYLLNWSEVLVGRMLVWDLKVDLPCSGWVRGGNGRMEEEGGATRVASLGKLTGLLHWLAGLLPPPRLKGSICLLGNVYAAPIIVDRWPMR